MADKLNENQRSEYFLAELRAYRAYLELEQTYQHWDQGQHYVFKLALKWLDQRFGYLATATR